MQFVMEKEKHNNGARTQGDREKKWGRLFFSQIATDSLMTVPVFPRQDLSEDPGVY